ncbi:MAG: SLBB domain-containing protein [Planctomycetota bacterium]
MRFMMMCFCAALMVCVAGLTGSSRAADGEAESYRFIGGEKIQLRFQPEGVAAVNEQIVSDDGNISLPSGTSLKIRGKAPAEAQLLIAEQMVKETSAKNVQVRMLILDYPPRKIYVAGEVRMPKSIVLTPGVPLSLLGALQEAGGVNEQGDATRVNVVHTDVDGKRSGSTYDITKLAQPGSADLGPKLLAGDTVLVPRCDHFTFSGEFNKVGVISLGDLRMEAGEKPLLSRVIAGLGGWKKDADVKKLKILRVKPDGTREVIAPFENAAGTQDLMLQNKDIVEVPAKQSAKESGPVTSVYISGKVRVPGLYPIGEGGLRLSKLIMLAGGLTEFAKGSKVTINRPSEPGTLRTIDVTSILKKGQWELDVDLKDGDVVNVPERAF